MKRAITFALLLSGSLFSSIQAKQSLSFGIVDNHRPHVYLDKEEQPSGSLINYVYSLCEDLEADCNFSVGSFFNHIERLQSGEINALLVTDTVLIPAIDDIIFTPPLCKISPVFIYKVEGNEPAFKTIDEIKNVTIGVHLDSSYHLYLLDEYYSHSRIKPYSLIESGVFDLANDRIDALLAEQSFFEAQVATTTLVSKKKSYYLDTIELGEIDIPFETMSLALRANDSALHADLSKLIEAHGPTESCVDLVRKTLKEDNSEESSSEVSENEPPAQGNETNETAK